jgi:hypothetical protein
MPCPSQCGSPGAAVLTKRSDSVETPELAIDKGRSLKGPKIKKKKDVALALVVLTIGISQAFL